MKGAPRISVVVPLFNEALRLPRLLPALLSQSLGPDLYEILLVDNNSTDHTAARALRIGGTRVKILSEKARQNADAARNQGIAHAAGEIFAFTDGDCIPRLDWLECGLRAMTGADLAAGRIAFTFSPRPSAAEAYDAVSFLQHEDSVRDRGIAFTANLFVRREIFEAIGMFDISAEWNGDAWFTRKATRAGFRLVYAGNAVVAHPARSLRPLLTKVWRISRGAGQAIGGRKAVQAAPARRRKPWQIIEPKPHLRNLNPLRLKRAIRRLDVFVPATRQFQALAIAYLVAVVALIGRARGILASRA